ncbi:MAG: YceI family protein [Deltaproteobacteria bacterium]|nr:YceI family protein [Deltaproteobacteria bacterium]MBW2294068.1 YceI family protein [Deltaproteobacteria bacterium]MBW2725553.1 YceI family protein [Deltaproteobacteria bacterium]
MHTSITRTVSDGPKREGRGLFDLGRFFFVFVLLSGSLMLVPLGVFAEGAESADAPGRITFVGKNMVATANGVFHRWKVLESQIDLDAIENGHLVVEIDIASLDTDSKRRDDHLRTADFFDVERWPTARVRVHNAVHVEGERYRAQFDIEIRDVVKTIVGDFEIVSRAPLSVRGSVTIDRTAFGVGTPKNWNPMSITNEVPLGFELTLPD